MSHAVPRLRSALVVLACALASVGARSDGLGDVLGNVKRALPGTVQDAVNKARAPAPQPDPPARSTTTANPSSNPFPAPPCVSSSKASANTFELNNGCDRTVAILSTGRGGQCGTIRLKPGMRLLAVPTAVCDSDLSRSWTAATCTCEDLAKIGRLEAPAAASSQARTQGGGSSQAATSQTSGVIGACIETNNESGHPVLVNRCGRDLLLLQKANDDNGCRHGKYPQRGRVAAAKAVAICEVDRQERHSCNCTGGTVWKGGGS